MALTLARPESRTNTLGYRASGVGPIHHYSPMPGETREIHGREYEIFVDGDRVKTIAWHRGENSYWISRDITFPPPTSR